MRIKARALPSNRRSSFRSQRHRSVVIFGEACPKAAVSLGRSRAPRSGRGRCAGPSLGVAVPAFSVCEVNSAMTAARDPQRIRRSIPATSR